MKIRKGDRVVVLAGKDKGKEGTVTRAIPKADKVVVEGVNVAQRHRKPTKAMEQGARSIICASTNVCSTPSRWRASMNCVRRVNSLLGMPPGPDS